MGQSLFKGGKSRELPPLVEETQFFATWTIADVRELWKRFQKSVFGFALVEAQFESIMAFKDVSKHVELETLFEILDYNHDGRIDGLEFLGGLALCCQASFEEKARFCFEMYDFNLNASMSEKEMAIMMMASISGMALLTGSTEGKESMIPSVADLDKIVKNAFERADKNKSGSINLEEFMGWARSNRDVMSSVELLSKVASNAKTNLDDEDSAQETDEGELSDAEQGVEHGADLNAGDADDRGDGSASESFVQWKTQVKNLEPTNYKSTKKSIEGPEANLELSWVHGYRSHSRNNVFYVCGGGAGASGGEATHAVWPAAALCVIYDLAKKEQFFYQGHSDEVTCIAMHPKCTFVATGDCKGNIHVWSPLTQEVKYIIKCLVKNGVQHVRFSPAGDRILAVGADADHTVTIYSLAGAVLSSGKSIASPNNVYDVAFSPKGDELCLVGRQQVLFFRGVDSGKRALDGILGRIGKKGKKQTFFCVEYLTTGAERDNCCVVGCASGDLYRLVGGVVVQVVQAHGVTEPVLSMSYNADEGVLLTGGKDSLIRSWDSTLKEIGIPLDMSEDLDGDQQGCDDTAVISVQLNKSHILVATRGCDIFEAIMPANVHQGYSLTRLNWGHASGSLCGLATHPTREEFATCGDDKTLRLWSIRSHEQTNHRKLIKEARSLSYSPSGDTLCVGMEDGTVAMIETKHPALRVFDTWKHSAHPITSAKFSPNGLFLAVASLDRNIYIYKSEDKRRFRRQAVCRGHTQAVQHLDFSANSLYIQSNGDDLALLHWDLFGNQIKNAGILRDTQWATLSCPFAWATQGIWEASSGDSSSSPQQSGYINSCYCIPEVEDLVAGDNLHRVNLFRYPAVRYDAPFLSYIGHAAPVARVRVSANKRYVISIGGPDRTILLWRHEIEQADDTDDEAGVKGGYGSDSSNDSGTEDQLAVAINDFGDLRKRSLIEDAVVANATHHEIAALLQQQSELQSHGQTSLAVVERWRASIIEPSIRKQTKNITNDVDLTLRWVHGYRSRDSRNSLRYSASGRIIYTAASLGVVYSKTSGKQTFLLGAHSEEIMGMAMHPNGQIVATGDGSAKPSVVIWNSSDTKVYQRIEGSHEVGIPLLAFSSKGQFLASVGMDRCHTLVLHDWQNGIEIMRTPTQRRGITCLAFLANAGDSGVPDGSGKRPPQDIIVTGGERHLTFWWTQGSNVKSQRALWGKAREGRKFGISCVASGNPDICVTGSVNGALVVWYKFKAVSDTMGYVKRAEMRSEPSTHTPTETGWKYWGFDGQNATYPHEGSAITSLWAIPGDISQEPDDQSIPNDKGDHLSTSARYVSADAKGRIVIWRLCVCDTDLETAFHLRPVQVLHFTTDKKSAELSGLKPTPISSSIRSVCERDGMLLVGTSAGEIYEIIETSIELLQRPFVASGGGGGGAQREQVPSHPPLRTQRLLASHARGEVCGLVSHPFLPFTFSSGDDHTLRCWSLAENRMLSFVYLPQKAKSLDIAPWGDDPELIVSLNDGAVWSLPSSLLLKPENSIVTGPVDLNQIGESVPEGSVEKKRVELPISTSHGDHQHCGELVRCSPGVKLPDSDKRCAFIALGCHDQSIRFWLRDQSKGGDRDPASYQCLDSIKHGHLTDGYVTHMDFGVMLVNNAPHSKRWQQVYDREKGQMIHLARAVGPPPPSVGFKGKLGSIAEDPESPRPDADKPPKDRDLQLTDLVLQVATSCRQLLYFRFDGAKKQWAPISAPEAKDVAWVSWTLPFGWPVQGVWPSPANGSRVLSVARPKSFESIGMLATSDSYGGLRLFSYPCVSSGTPDKLYKGHCGPVNNCVFNCDDSILVSVGGHDRCVFVWETDVLDELRERRALKTGSFGEDQLAAQVAEHDQDARSGLSQSGGSGGGADGGQPLVLIPLKARSITVKLPERPIPAPWQSVVREPTGWAEPKGSGEQPIASLELKFVYGYRGWDCRNNIGFAGSTGQIVYHVGGVGISQSVERHSQVHNTEHAPSDIISLAVHPDGHTVATGEVAPKARILLWDANTGVTIRCLWFHRVGVNNICFSKDGELLVSLGLDHEHMICVHNLATGAVVGTGKAGSSPLYTLSVSNDGRFLTGGENHIKFWDLPPANMAGGMIGVKSGIYNNKAVQCHTVLASAYLGVDGVTGMADGTLLLWKERSSTRFVQAHTGPITSLWGLSESSNAGGGEPGPRVLSGGRDGLVHIWSYKLNKLWTFSLIDGWAGMTTPVSCLPAINALCMQDDQLLVGTLGCEIYMIDVVTNDVLQLVQGHYDERCELWGLATHVSSHKFVTACDDGTVRLWDARTMRPLGLSKQADGTRVRTLTYKPDGSQVVIGTLEGRLVVLSSDLTEEIAEVTVCSCGIRALAFSPDGQTLAVGAADGRVHFLDSKFFSCHASTRPVSGSVRSLDFSADSALIQVASFNFELKYFDRAMGKQIKSPSLLRDVKWATGSSSFGWATQGLWPIVTSAGGSASSAGAGAGAIAGESERTTIVAGCAVSPDAKMVLSGDNKARLRLHRYPASVENAKFREYRGHCGGITNVAFTFDGRFALSVSGLDKSIMQFEVKQPKTFSAPAV